MWVATEGKLELRIKNKELRIKKSAWEAPLLSPKIANPNK